MKNIRIQVPFMWAVCMLVLDTVVFLINRPLLWNKLLTSLALYTLLGIYCFIYREVQKENNLQEWLKNLLLVLLFFLGIGLTIYVLLSAIASIVIIVNIIGEVLHEVDLTPMNLVLFLTLFFAIPLWISQIIMLFILPKSVAAVVKTLTDKRPPNHS